MESRNRYDGVDAYAVTKIRYQAHQLARSRAFHLSDIEDLEQELMLDLFRRLPAFDPSRASRNTFIARVVENCAASLIQTAMAEKRGTEVVHESLQTGASDVEGDWLELGDTIPADNGLWDGGDRGWDEAIEFRHDLERVLRRLPPCLVAVCGRLAVHTVTEISRTTGMSRPSIYDALADVRQAMAGAGLEAYA